MKKKNNNYNKIYMFFDMYIYVFKNLWYVGWIVFEINYV